jgi:hypothetical protein
VWDLASGTSITNDPESRHLMCMDRKGVTAVDLTTERDNMNMNKTRPLITLFWAWTTHFHKLLGPEFVDPKHLLRCDMHIDKQCQARPLSPSCFYFVSPMISGCLRTKMSGLTKAALPRPVPRINASKKERHV